MPPFPFNFLLQIAEQVEERLTQFMYVCHKKEMQEYQFDKRMLNANDPAATYSAGSS